MCGSSRIARKQFPWLVEFIHKCINHALRGGRIFVIYVHDMCLHEVAEFSVQFFRLGLYFTRKHNEMAQHKYLT